MKDLIIASLTKAIEELKKPQTVNAGKIRKKNYKKSKKSKKTNKSKKRKNRTSNKNNKKSRRQKRQNLIHLYEKNREYKKLSTL